MRLAAIPSLSSASRPVRVAAIARLKIPSVPGTNPTAAPYTYRGTAPTHRVPRSAACRRRSVSCAP